MLSRFLLPLVFLLASGCATTGGNTPELPVQPPSNWSTEAATAPANNAWLTDFNDQTLSALIDSALSENFDLAAATARVQAARAQARIAGAPRLPQLSTGLGGSRSKRSGSSGFAVSAPISNSFDLGGDLTWEADLWGRLSAQARAATFNEQSSLADYQAARLSLAANIASGWFNLGEAQLQQRLASEQLTNFRANLDIIEQRYRDGLSSALDLRLLRSNVANAEAQVAATDRDLDVRKRNLQVLLGQHPDANFTAPQTLPELNKAVPVGLPMQLLERRPDLRAAALQMFARGADNAAAERNWLPRLALTASGGTASSQFRELFDLDQLIWSIAANLTAPIFQGGRLKGERELAQANLELAVANYGQQALIAFNEVELALAAELTLARQHRAVARAAEESTAAEALALEQYGRGLVDIITLLEAQRRSVDAQRSLLSLRNLRLQNRINLHLALGGDFAESSSKDN